MSGEWLAFVNIAVYLLAGLFCGRVYWQANAKERECLTNEDAVVPMALFFFWPLWLLWHAGKFLLRGFFLLADFVTFCLIEHGYGKRR